jgi:hypothetical protein
MYRAARALGTQSVAFIHSYISYIALLVMIACGAPLALIGDVRLRLLDRTH